MSDNNDLGSRGARREPATEPLPDAMSGRFWRDPGRRGGQRELTPLLVSLPIAACSATSSVEHSPAQFRLIDSTFTVEAGRDLVLEQLTARLPQAGFTLVEIDEGLKVLRASLTTDQPDAYVDCGRSRRTFEGAWGPPETFEYGPASSASYKLVSHDGMPLEATRGVMLDATASIRTSSKDAMTEVSVDVSYDLSARIEYHELGMFDSPTGQVRTVAREVHFQTAEPGIGDEEVAFCMSNGRLEAQILELATQTSRPAIRRHDIGAPE